jgi:hypothetical protein
MNKKLLAFFSLLIIMVFIGYIIYDTVRTDSDSGDKAQDLNESAPPDQWFVSKEAAVNEGLQAVAVSADGAVYLGGDAFVACYNKDLHQIWNLGISGKIKALTVNDDTVFAASEEMIFIINHDGKMIAEWGPYEANSIITSLSANNRYVAFADAGNKRVFILNKNGEVVSMIGQSGEKFIIPSPYFDVYLTDDNTLFLANTGNFRIEKWTIEGRFLSTFGGPGTAPDAFCGCCNPAHFTVVPQGFVTAEKGINRIKIMGPEGGFIEYVSSENKFIASVPLDVASVDGKTIYAANPADSRLYVYTRKQ